jgi:Orsellinic acid/F9775 biosynthesis cluster protein D
MDLLEFNPQYKVAICLRCQCALVRTEIASHLRSLHKKEALTNGEIRECAQKFLIKPIDPPKVTQRLQVPLSSPPIPILALYKDGFCCKLCQSTRPYVCRPLRALTDHLRRVHQRTRPRGRQPTSR